MAHPRSTGDLAAGYDPRARAKIGSHPRRPRPAARSIARLLRASGIGSGLVLTPLLCFVAGAALSAQASAADWHELAPLPEQLGLAGCFAGVSGDVLLVAGGANFPDRMPWEGGTKQWTDAVWRLDQPSGTWQTAGRLPRPLAYGVSITDDRGLICAGGSNAQGHFRDVFRLVYRDGQVRQEPLAELPRAIANACGARLGSGFYLAGGLESPNATKTLHALLRLDLSTTAARWEELAPWPGQARMFAVAAAMRDEFWLIGGVDLEADPSGSAKRHYLRDAYRYRPGEGWRTLAKLPCPLAAAPSPAPAGDDTLWLLGGDDGAQLGARPSEHRGFLRGTIAWDAARQSWSRGARLPLAVVTAPVARWRDGWVVVSGEVAPGRRSPRVWIWPAPVARP